MTDGTARAAATRRGKDEQAETQIATSVDAFRRILRELRIVARKTEFATGLTAAQLFVLTAVVDSPGCSLNEIATATMTDRSSVANVIDRLVEQGFVTRAQADDDRRRASISITARGRRAMQKAAPPPTAVLISGLRQLSVLELESLADGLAALTGAMGIANEPAGMLFEDTPERKRPRAARPRTGPRPNADG